MEYLQNWVRSLAALVVLLSLVELILPQDSLKPYVRMVLGLLVVVALVRPILHNMTHWEHQVPVVELDIGNNLNNLKALGDKVRAKGVQAAKEYFPQETGVSQILRARIPGLEGAEIRCQRGTLRVRLRREDPVVSKEDICRVLREADREMVKVEVIRDGE